MKWLEMAAKYGLAAANEDDAREKVMAYAHAGGELMTALGARTPAEAAKKLADLQTAAAKVPELTAERDELKKARDAQRDADRAAYIDDVMAAEYAALPKPAVAGVRKSLEMHAKADWDDFEKAHPRPSRAELGQRAQDTKRTERVTNKGGRGRAPADVGATREISDETVGEALNAAATDLYLARRNEGNAISFSDAIAEVRASLAAGAPGALPGAADEDEAPAG